jgi:hypothetical protein
VSTRQETGLLPLFPIALWKPQEAKLLKELLYCFHGIAGQVLTVTHRNYDELPIFELAKKVLKIVTDFQAGLNLKTFL